MENWKTSVGGLLVAVGMLGRSMPEEFRPYCEFLGVVGAALLGMTAKDFNTHSTVNEVNKATKEKAE